MLFAKAPIAVIFLLLLATSPASAEVSISIDNEGRTQVQVGNSRVSRYYRQRQRRIKRASRHNRPILVTPPESSGTYDTSNDEEEYRRSDRSTGNSVYQRSTQTVTVNGRTHTVTQTTRY